MTTYNNRRFLLALQAKDNARREDFKRRLAQAGKTRPGTPAEISQKLDKLIALLENQQKGRTDNE